jgi:hypothetical protein
MIIDALSSAYDTVLVECGAADIAAVGKVARVPGTEIIISAPDVADDQVIDLIAGFGEAGFDEVVLMTGASHPYSGEPGRRAA